MIDCKALTVLQGAFRMGPLDFQLPSGAYGVIMGPTGCGKTTLIEAIVGLRQVESGSIHLGSTDITHADPAVRGIGYVPQDGAMFPTMSVAEQLAYGLHIRRMKQPLIRERVNDLAERLGISHILSRMPQGLSGGERQRVALGRALAIEPALLILDEPLAALDEDKRSGMCELLQSVHKEFNTTVIHITHARVEADMLATHRYDMAEGKIVSVSDGARTLVGDGIEEDAT